MATGLKTERGPQMCNKEEKHLLKVFLHSFKDARFFSPVSHIWVLLETDDETEGREKCN